MRLSDILSNQTIVLDFDAKDKWDAIHKLVDLLIERGKIKKVDKDIILDALIARERIASTGMEYGVALPHASVEVLNLPICALGISHKGIEFQTQDGRPAKLIVLMVVPKKDIQIHIKALTGIARLLNYEQMRQMLLSAQSPHEVMDIIKEEEEKEFA
jgi:mannitol/fructose-specific phosphotransferase system IIA component (Ntr-type)